MPAHNEDVTLGVSQSLKNDPVPELELSLRKVAELKPSEHRARKITKKQVERVAKSVQGLGFVQPVLVRGSEIIDGHVRVEAAKKLGIEEIPCIDVTHLNADEVRLLRLAVNKLPERGTWDQDALQREFTYQLEIDADLSVTGFDGWEVDAALSIGKAYSEPDTIEPVAEPDQPDMSTVTQLGDT